MLGARHGDGPDYTRSSPCIGIFTILPLRWGLSVYINDLIDYQRAIVIRDTLPGILKHFYSGYISGTGEAPRKFIPMQKIKGSDQYNGSSAVRDVVSCYRIIYITSHEYYARRELFGTVTAYKANSDPFLNTRSIL